MTGAIKESAANPQDSDAVEQRAVRDIPAIRRKREKADRIAVESEVTPCLKKAEVTRRIRAQGVWIHHNRSRGTIRPSERGMATNKPAIESIANDVAICVISGNYRSLLLGLFRASANGGEISLFRSAKRLKSARGRRSRVLSTALRRHSFMSST